MPCLEIPIASCQVFWEDITSDFYLSRGHKSLQSMTMLWKTIFWALSRTTGFGKCIWASVFYTNTGMPHSQSPKDHMFWFCETWFVPVHLPNMSYRKEMLASLICKSLFLAKYDLTMAIVYLTSSWTFGVCNSKPYFTSSSTRASAFQSACKCMT